MGLPSSLLLLNLDCSKRDQGCCEEKGCSWLTFPFSTLSLVSENYSPGQGHIHIYEAHVTHAPKHCTRF